MFTTRNALAAIIGLSHATEMEHVQTRFAQSAHTHREMSMNTARLFASLTAVKAEIAAAQTPGAMSTDISTLQASVQHISDILEKDVMTTKNNSRVCALTNGFAMLTANVDNAAAANTCLVALQTDVAAAEAAQLAQKTALPIKLARLDVIETKLLALDALKIKLAALQQSVEDAQLDQLANTQALETAIQDITAPDYATLFSEQKVMIEAQTFEDSAGVFFSQTNGFIILGEQEYGTFDLDPGQMFEFTLQSYKFRGASDPRTTVSFELRDDDDNTLVIETYEEFASTRTDRNFFLYYKGIVAGDIGSGSKTYKIIVTTQTTPTDNRTIRLRPRSTFWSYTLLPDGYQNLAPTVKPAFYGNVAASSTSGALFN